MTLPSIKLTAFPQPSYHYEALAWHHAASAVMIGVMLGMTMADGARIKQDDRFASITHMIDFALHSAQDAHFAVADLMKGIFTFRRVPPIVAAQGLGPVDKVWQPYFGCGQGEECRE
ncbi:hypothetical protein [Agrobacterium radiobacter]|uniref:hypothetical protein n=1 Tax=Agrobacterium radiobacter TaxID=362 RepID=UPI003F87ADCA